MMVLAMAPLLPDAEPAIVLEKRDEFFDLRWHRPRIVLGLSLFDYLAALKQLCAN